MGKKVIRTIGLIIMAVTCLFVMLPSLSYQLGYDYFLIKKILLQIMAVTIFLGLFIRYKEHKNILPIVFSFLGCICIIYISNFYTGNIKLLFSYISIGFLLLAILLNAYILSKDKI